MTTPIERLASLVIGVVESVSADEIRVLLDLDAPHSTALNTGTPSAFPRINGYVLIPNEAGATVAYIRWIGIERSPYPKRSGLKDFGLIDLPFPLRMMSISPVGTLTTHRHQASGSVRFELERGVIAFPSVGDQVRMPTPEQVSAIVGGRVADRRVRIGTSPMAGNASIMVDPDKLFGRHLAVLGNTGSGKSCTVAGLIRWSMDAANAAINKVGEPRQPNARFIVLDPNGEYASAFADRGEKLRVFRVPPIEAPEKPLAVPAWLWNGHEWAAVSSAQPGAQRPLLMQGIRTLKSGQAAGAPREAIIRRYLQSYSIRISALLSAGTHTFAGSHKSRFECARLLETMTSDCRQFAVGLQEGVERALIEMATLVTTTVTRRKSGDYYNDFAIADLEGIRAELDGLVAVLPDLPAAGPVSEDSPVFFDINLLAEHLEKTATEQGGNVAGFISTLGMRIRGMLADHRLAGVIGPNPAIPFDAWLKNYVGDNEASNGELAVIDLSLVPAEIIEVVLAVLARLVFESLQRYRRQHESGMTLPTVMVLEEAHTFVRKSRDADGPTVTASQLCRETFERIAREGRKFGFGLVLSSQRPSELSPTVLAQCNTFLLHRIVNDADQTLVSRLVPDNVGGLLRELPSLPSRQAILLGWATPIPVLVEVEELPQSQRPQSADPDFWAVWTHEKERKVDWRTIVDGWTGPDAVVPQAEE